MLRSAGTYPLSRAEAAAIKLVSDASPTKRINQCSLISMAACMNRKAYLDAMRLFPPSDFKKAVEDSIAGESATSEVNFTALNVIGWLVFSSGINLRPGFREAITKRAGSSSWDSASFTGFSDQAKQKDQPSGRDVARKRRDAYGQSEIAAAVARIKSKVVV